MKKIYTLASVLAILIGVWSCSQFNDVSDIKQVQKISTNLKVSLDLDDSPLPDELTVKFINYEERYEVTKNVTLSGQSSPQIMVDNIIPGIYTITVSAEKSEDGFTYNYSGNVVNMPITNPNSIVDIDVSAAKSGALVLKEVFYCGSRTPTGGSYFRDQYYEIYNNSDFIQNVKGLCIAILHPMTATANLPQWPGEDAHLYVYASTIWQVPDNMDYPINPGESIIIAQMADNHQQAHLNLNSPVNLLSAEFETFVNSTSLIRDNPAINMRMAFWPSPTPQWLTTVFGAALVIFYPSEPIDPNKTVSPIGLTSRHYRILIKDVVDGVEFVGNANQVQLKRMPAVIDAGAMTVGGTYLGVSAARKVRETKDGRVILYDTNNSSDDFEVMQTPQIRRYGAKAPAWNTWK